MERESRSWKLGSRFHSNFRLWIIVGAILGFLPTGLFEANSGILFGKTEKLHELSEVNLQGQGGEEMSLAFKTSTVVVGLGLYCKDDGYVLCRRNDLTKYYHLPGTEITRLQRAGLLPDPLPLYSVPWHEYVLGYSMWWITVTVAAVMMVHDRIKRKAPPGSRSLGSAPPPLS